MASSTADLTAAIEALARAFNVSLSDDAMARLLTRVEPSDCVHFPGNLRVLVVDCGGAVDTVTFDRERARSVYRRNSATIANALRLVKRGLRSGNEREIAAAATQSASLSQQILYKPQFSDLLKLTTEAGALGVNCAHSGTVLGVLHRAADRLHDKLCAAIEWTFRNDAAIVGDFAIIGGGCVDY